LSTIIEIAQNIMIKNGLVMSFLIIGVLMWLSSIISKYITKGRIHSSAIAIFLGLVLAYIGGVVTGGDKGIADISIFAGVEILGGSMLRDFTIVSTAYGVALSEIKKCGIVGVVSLILGVISAFLVGAIIAACFGYKDAVSITTIAAGAVTFVVGPVTGTALGASSPVITISIAAGVVKSVAVMVITPFAAKKIGLTTPKAAMIYGGLMGTTSGTAAGLAATDARLVPYGAMTATFYTGLGCLLCPTVLFWLTRLIFAM
jgi:malonate transporter MadM subunit